jgi:hypothetical protein
LTIRTLQKVDFVPKYLKISFKKEWLV